MNELHGKIGFIILESIPLTEYTLDGKIVDRILDAVIEALPEVQIKTRGTTQNPDNAAYWTKSTLARFETIEEIKGILAASKSKQAGE